MQKCLAKIILLMVALISLDESVTAQQTSDLRTEKLKREGYTNQNASEGRKLLRNVAERHGLKAWQQHETAQMICIDEWPEGLKGWWPEKQQRLKMQALLGTFTSRVQLLNSDLQGEIWGIQSWHGYKRSSSGDVRFVDDKVLTFYLPTLQYFAELPFRLLAAELVADAGAKSLSGKEYYLVLATWGSLQPNLEHDQYLLWINQKTLLVEMCLYTLREANNWATGTIHFKDYRDVQGVMFPFEHIIVLPWPEHTVYPLEENFFHRTTFEEVSFDAIDGNTLLVAPDKRVGDFKRVSDR